MLFFLIQIKEQIKAARFKASLAANSELLKLYWNIGQNILERQKTAIWGSKLLEQLSLDLRNSFPEMKGFSVSNLKRMRKFAELYPEIGAQPAHQLWMLPWHHIVVLNEKIQDSEEKTWYMIQTLENGWSRPNLERQIQSQLYARQGINSNKNTNFLTRLPAPQSELALDLLKHPYNLEFTGLNEGAHEREIEVKSIAHISKFLIELGKGFAFVGSQVPIEVDEEEFFMDMLFYHIKLHCYVVIEIKSTKFRPEHAGQLNFYLTAVDEVMKSDLDNPTIGILLCKSHNKVVAEYALKNVNSPIGISNYELTQAVPKDLKSSLPTIEEIEFELTKVENPQRRE